MYFFAVESFDVFLLENIQYEVRFVVEGRKLFFDEILCMFWIAWLANWRIGFYKRWLAHILSGRMLDFELRKV